MKIKTSQYIYAHIDCDSFFASCEIYNNPQLKNKYVCVGGEIIVAATYNAKKLGVKVGTPLWEAQRILKNKDAYFCGVNMASYVDISRKLMAYLREHTLDVRVFSVDEAFVEIS
jgi:nucleotidyltransferase/DNA polymerase involved in DNA repair